jgi:hypothetical protein
MLRFFVTQELNAPKGFSAMHCLPPSFVASGQIGIYGVLIPRSILRRRIKQRPHIDRLQFFVVHPRQVDDAGGQSSLDCPTANRRIGTPHKGLCEQRRAYVTLHAQLLGFRSNDGIRQHGLVYPQQLVQGLRVAFLG